MFNDDIAVYSPPSVISIKESKEKEKQNETRRRQQKGGGN
jgi:hypothetical protein